MTTALALLLAAFMNSHGTATNVVDNGNGTAIVVVEGRPGCTAEALQGDPRTPVVVCRGRAQR